MKRTLQTQDTHLQIGVGDDTAIQGHRAPDAPGIVPIRNANLERLTGEVDHLYHLGLHSGMDLEGMFHDTKFVCMGGSPQRIERFAFEVSIALSLGDVQPPAVGKTERFSLYKVGPVICVSHGMGMPSHSILLHEITKLLHYAGATDVIYIRIGTSGGVGVSGGTVVVGKCAINGELQAKFKRVVLGRVVENSTEFDEALADEVVALSQIEPPITCVLGNTMGTDDFYEGQARLDGAICEFTEADRIDFLNRAHAAGVRNIEMEAPQYAAFCRRLGIRAVSINTCLLNRLNGDQIASSAEELAQFSANAQLLALRFVKARLEKK